MKARKSFLKLLFWVTLAILFNIYVYITRGQRAGIEFLGGYIIEMSLSLDNLFLFLMIFSTFHVEEEYQERILKFGIFGAMILRLIFILLGVGIIHKFHWVLYIFGGLLVISGFKMLLDKHETKVSTNNVLVKLINCIIPITDTIHGDRFFVKMNNILYATPLFVILVIIESSDVIFALDSIPAIFSVTTDTFIVYTSNIFAILGLRSMYYILLRLNNMFRYMKHGVAFILMFTGLKLILLFFNIELSVLVSILMIVIILLTSILFSLIFDDGHRKYRH
ncbi:TerC/Alx family metal homeostasis membrane protein [Clostridium sp.]|uniref:TerC/Alx family metal homeostasis membrane protein n=1 Tax=Clostridium sp. TaxID=1506 RepID=UPI003F41098E